MIPLDTGDFSLMDRRVVEAVLAMPERDHFLDWEIPRPLPYGGQVTHG